MLFKLLKRLKKQLCCKHEYEFWRRLYNHDIETEVTYRCVKCGKLKVLKIAKDVKL